MGIFSRMKDGMSAKANAALDKAIDPAKEVELTILELEAQRKKALEELISYKATAKQMEAEQQKFLDKAATWEKRAMTAVKAGDDEAAKTALREKKSALVEAAKIKRDRDEAAGYAVQLNKSRKDFETKLQILKLKKGTLATQIASARSATGDPFGNDGSVWDKFASAEERIEGDVIATEVDAAMRGEEVEAAAFDAKLARASESAGLLGAGDGVPAEDALSKLKSKMAAEKAAKQKALAAKSGEGAAKDNDAAKAAKPDDAADTANAAKPDTAAEPGAKDKP